MSRPGWKIILRHGVARSFWAGMFLAHAPAWLLACADAGGFDALRWLVLTLSQLFFLLKVCDVRWLRLPASRRAWLIATLTVALLHAGVAQRLAEYGERCPPALPAVIEAAAVAAAGVVVLRKLLRIQARAVRRQLHTALVLCRSRTQQAFLPPRYLLLARACAVNRAPPR